MAIDFTLPRAVALRGQVLDAGGRPAAGVHMRRMNHEVTRTDAAGCFDLGPSLPPGEAVSLQFYSRDRSDGALAEVTPDQVEGELVVRLEPLPTVTGRVSDEAGAPVGDAWVGVDRQVSLGSGMRGFAFDSMATAISDAEGSFSLAFLPGLPCRVWVEADGFGVAEQFPVELPRGKPTEPLRFILQRADGFVTGVVVDPEGQPIAGVRVGARRVQANRVIAPVAETTTDAEGRFRLAPLPPGEVRLQAYRSGYYPELRGRVAVGASQVRLMLAPLEAPVPPPPSAGTPAPEIEVTRWINGAGVRSLSELRGRRVVLQFSAAYNRAAMESNHVLSALQTTLRAAGRDDVALLALYDGSIPAGEAEVYARSEGLLFPIGLAAGGVESPTFRAYGVRRLPTLFVIDWDGTIRAADPAPEELMRLLE